MYQKVDEGFIGDVLSNYKEKKDRIEKEIQEMYSLLNEKSRMETDIIESVSYPNGLDEKGTRRFGDVGAVFLAYAKLMQEHQTSIFHYIQKLVNELDSIHRVMLCFFLLDEKERELLEIFFRRYGGEKYDVRVHLTAGQLGMSDSTVKRRKNDAVQALKELYDSSCSSEELLRHLKEKA